MTPPLDKRSVLRALSMPGASAATCCYAAAAVLMTWPLAAGLGRDIPWDLGDSVLNCWILQWGADRWLRLLGGDLSALKGYFDANIFFPEPLTLAYSEHLTAQVLQILPIYAATRNIVLSYNLLFLSTFVLSGLGTYLLVRELTGSTRAAFLAGLFFAFAPYRIGQFSHLQVMSSQWMPLALFAFRRYFESKRLRPLVGAVAAVIAQNLSCGYFLVYFAPFVAAYVIYEIAARGLWFDLRMWTALSLAAAAVAGATAPFLWPYVELRARGFGPRPIDEVMRYSADVYSYLTAHGGQRLWGGFVRVFPKPEGELFPSVTPVVLALVGVWVHGLAVWRASAGPAPRPGPPAEPGPRQRWLRRIVVGVLALAVLQVLAAAGILLTAGIDWPIGPWTFRAHSLARALRGAALLGAVLLVLSPRARAFARGVPRSALAFFVMAALVAFCLSLGPVIHSKGLRLAGDGPYRWLYLNMPGFDGLRVPARMGMLVSLFLAVLGGYGCAAIGRLFRGAGWPAAAGLAAALVFLVESTPAPIELNGTWPAGDLRPPPARLLSGEQVSAVYQAVRAIPRNAALVEFPFGEEQWDLRYMVASAEHWRPLLNGYSGGFPASHSVHLATLGPVLSDPDRAWSVLSKTGVTHAIVHEGTYPAGTGARVSDWLRSHQASEVGTFGDDRLFSLRPSQRVGAQ